MSHPHDKPPPCPRCQGTRVTPWHECGEPHFDAASQVTTTNCTNGWSCNCGHSWED